MNVLLGLPAPLLVVLLAYDVGDLFSVGVLCSLTNEIADPVISEDLVRAHLWSLLEHGVVEELECMRCSTCEGWVELEDHPEISELDKKGHYLLSPFECHWCDQDSFIAHHQVWSPLIDFSPFR